MVKKVLYQFNLEENTNIAAGIYPYCVKDIRVENNATTPYGIKDRIIFIFDLTVKRKTRELVQPFYVSKDPESRFSHFMAMICKAYGWKNFDLRDLIGTAGEAVVAPNATKEGKEFMNVVTLTPQAKSPNAVQDEDNDSDIDDEFEDDEDGETVYSD